MSAISAGGGGAVDRNKLAIIIPFRDLRSEQKRSEHLRKFVEAMPNFLGRAGIPYTIYCIEQSNDDRKFNRGKLLNIGFDIANKEGCNIFVFHDVDLIPSIELLEYYTTFPSSPVHVANAWNDRYSVNDKYFGGIVTFSRDDYTRINGYPNNFWGWGGEDDELYKRVQKVKWSNFKIMIIMIIMMIMMIILIGSIALFLW